MGREWLGRLVLTAALVVGSACAEPPEPPLETYPSSAPETIETVDVVTSATSIPSVTPLVDLPRSTSPPWCGRVTVPLASEAEAQRLEEEFIRRNPGVGPPTASVSGSYIGRARAYRLEGDPRPRDEASAIAAARKLAEKNADLLGFTAAELRGADATTRRMPDYLWVDLRREIPRPGYEAFRTVARTVSIRIMFLNGMSIINSSPLPEFKMCLKAPLPATSPKITAAVVGQLFTDRWRPTLNDVTSTDLTILVEVDHQKRSATLTLAYEMKLGMSYSAFVDASSGVLLAVHPHFYESQ